MTQSAAPQRIIYMGTPEFAVPPLEALCAARARLGGEVVAVVTQPDRPAGRKQRLLPSPVKSAALAHGLPVFQPERLRNNPAAVQTLLDLEPTLIVVAAYGLILPQSVLEIPRFGCVNVHASLLPAYRGASPINAALLDGCTETGISIMLMDEGMDTGPVLAQSRTPIYPDDTADRLTTRLAQQGAALLIDTLAEYLTGTLAPVAQQDLPGTPSLCGRISKEDGRIDWNQPAAHIERMTRAYDPWPGAYTTWQDAPFKIIQAQVIPIATVQATTPPLAETTPGTVIAFSPAPADDSNPDNNPPATRIAVCTGTDLLALHQVQPAGKRAMDIASFLNGAPAFVGTRLGTSTD
ncbi:MAG: methionyl-tRNA formyltransferase [Litorilinea sp.]